VKKRNIELRKSKAYDDGKPLEKVLSKGMFVPAELCQPRNVSLKIETKTRRRKRRHAALENKSVKAGSELEHMADNDGDASQICKHGRGRMGRGACRKCRSLAVAMHRPFQPEVTPPSLVKGIIAARKGGNNRNRHACFIHVEAGYAGKLEERSYPSYEQVSPTLSVGLPACHSVCLYYKMWSPVNSPLAFLRL
jgi:hypothetical protein